MYFITEVFPKIVLALVLFNIVRSLYLSWDYLIRTKQIQEGKEVFYATAQKYEYSPAGGTHYNRYLEFINKHEEALLTYNRFFRSPVLSKIHCFTDLFISYFLCLKDD